MLQLATSAAGANGDGFGTLLAFDMDGSLLGRFSEDPRIVDPRGLVWDEENDLIFLNSGADRVLALNLDGIVVRDSGEIPGLNPGGGNFAPDRRYCVGLRSARTIAAFDPALSGPSDRILPEQVVPFPRGFAFDGEGRLFLASGTGPDGEGNDTILAFNAERRRLDAWKVEDPDLSPLDLIVAPNGNVVVASERPFGVPDAATTLREYDRRDGSLVRVFDTEGKAVLQRPRGLRFDPGGNLHCVAQDEIVAFDFSSGHCIGPTIRLDRLNGQALAFVVDPHRAVANRIARSRSREVQAR